MIRPEVEDALRKMVSTNRYMCLLGLELLEVGEGYAKMRMPYDDALLNPMGYLHGGALYSLADVTGGIACRAYGVNVVTTDGQIRYLSPARDTEYITCVASKEKQGTHIGVYRATLFDDAGNITDTGSFSYYILGDLEV